MSKRGTIREDGMVFAKMQNGKELWLTQEDFAVWRQKEIDRATRWQKKRSTEVATILNEIKTSRGCARCGYNANPVALDFDHIDRSTKSFDIGRMRSKTSIEKLLAEVDKCQVLCANCHRIKTFEEGDHLS